ncbi:NAD(P)-dependent dehydrogenase (short-subunit alcohol dehydrogenase family) [Rhodococcus sp. SMB37]|uniref:SDR family oxidoreductase n=1 Tax=Rhodococcus sp. SMB37 TaxID=2512213 RepID=UPI001053F9FC|nr:SDR family oxidoreductase [Rhodococcus sp. SMB37]TCN54277.1 NAD(P)-dependent dehydrogenase (short-subunit alcohol dehydrogenase family) [Rhodococcus sp. SMB37]
MGTYVVTGAASGMGRASAERLRAAGHTVIGIDLRDTDIVADLSTTAGRSAAIRKTLDRADGLLDGAVLAAGLGPIAGKEKVIAEVNVRGVIELLVGWRPALAATGNSKVVVFGSNSTTATPGVPKSAVRSFLAGDLDKGVKRASRIRAAAAPFTYAATKIAVTRWARRAAVTDDWAGSGIRLNVLAPGAVSTPLLETQLAGPQAKRVEGFPVPIGGFGDAEQIAEWVEFMLSRTADFMVGSVVTVDGGTEAYFRSGDWPVAVPLSGLPRYLLQMFRFRP